MADKVWLVWVDRENPMGCSCCELSGEDMLVGVFSSPDAAREAAREAARDEHAQYVEDMDEEDAASGDVGPRIVEGETSVSAKYLDGDDGDTVSFYWVEHPIL